MNIKTICVSVNYIDLLNYTWNLNKSELDDYTIITDKKDSNTHKFCEQNGINCYKTDAFYTNKDKFSKSSALNEFFLSEIDTNTTEWILLMDSDIVLNNTLSRFKYHYQKQNLESVIIPNDNSIGNGIPVYFGRKPPKETRLIYSQDIKTNSSIHNPNDIPIEECLFGCARQIYECKLDYENKISKLEKCFFYGYFQLFHINAIKEKILNNEQVFTYHGTADKYDMDFAREYWAFAQKKTLSFTVHHLGPIGSNWSGRKSEKWS